MDAEIHSQALTLHQPLITVGILTYNRDRTIPKCLAALEACSYPKSQMRIVFVDNFSEDTTPEILREFAQKHRAHYEKISILSQRTNIPQGRNLCVKNAAGRFLLFLDSDVILPANGIGRMLHVFGSDTRIAAVGFPYRFIGGSWSEIKYRLTQPSIPHLALVLHAGCTMFRIETFTNIGLFNERRTLLEDADIIVRAYKAGYFALLDPALEAIHLRQWGEGVRWEISLFVLPFFKTLAKQHFDHESFESETSLGYPLLSRSTPIALIASWYLRVAVSLILMLFYACSLALRFPRRSGAWRLINPMMFPLFGVSFAGLLIRQVVEYDL